MTDMISFKAFLRLTDSKEDYDEAQRFVMGKTGDNLAFAALEKKLRSVFSVLTSGQTSFAVTWTDSDADIITISSDEGLQVALNEMAPLARITVTCDGGLGSWRRRPAVGSDANAAVHPHVICDGCNRPLRGFRYRCMTCPDYDLCSNCERAGFHPDHNMLRMVKPCDPEGLFKVAEGGTKPASQNDIGNGEDCIVESMIKAEPNAKANMEKDKDLLGSIGAEPDLIIHHLLSDLPRFLNRIRCESSDPVLKVIQDQLLNSAMFQELIRTVQATPDACEGLHLHDSEVNRQMSDSVDFLHAIGRLVSAVLHPIGVDVEIEVKSSDETDADPTTPSSAQVGGPLTDVQQGDCLDGQFESERVSFPVRSTGNEAFASMANCCNILKADDHQRPKVDNEEVIAAEHDSMRMNKAISGTSITGKIGTNARIEEHGATSLPGAERSQFPDHKIWMALQAMLSMGFTNDNDRLANLLIEQNGNIIKVLDILQPAVK